MTKLEKADYGQGVGMFITNLLYATPQVGVREYIVNCADEYANPQTQGSKNYGRIDVIFNPATRSLTFTDYASGIKDSSDFKRFFSVETEPSKTVGSRTSTLDNQDDNIAGLFHIGKAVAIKMSRKKIGTVAIFRSNNGQRGEILHLANNGHKAPAWDADGYCRYEGEHAYLVKPERGLSVEILDVVDELTDIGQLEGEIKRVFSLRMAKGLDILISDDGQKFKKIEPLQGLPLNEVTDAKELRLANGKYVTYAVKPSLKPKYLNIDVYKHYYLIKSIHSDAAVEGWINCNAFELTAARDNFQSGKDTVYSEGIQKTVAHLQSKFGMQHGKKEMTATKGLIKSAQLIAKAISKVFQDERLWSGKPNEDSVTIGDITDIGNNDDAGSWQQKHDKRLLRTGGDPSAPPFMSIGTGTKHPPGPIPTPGGQGPHRTYEDGGTHTIIERTNGPRIRKGRIEPHIIPTWGRLEGDGRICVMTDPLHIVINEANTIVQALPDYGERRRNEFLSGEMVQAAVEFEARERPMSIEEFRTKCSEVLAEVRGIYGGQN